MMGDLRTRPQALASKNLRVYGGFMDAKEIIDTATNILRNERDAIDQLMRTLGEDFVQAIETMRHCKGQVVLSGVGKSFLIAQKISASMASTGTPSIPLHPVDALHGDLGRVREDDVVISLSNSGSSDEIVDFAKALKPLHVKTIVMTCKRESPLAKLSDIVLDIGDLKEACPLGVAPSTTTTAMLALGDALTLTLSTAKGFTLEGFASNHPNGSLGRKLRPVMELARPFEATATVTESDTVLGALNAITAKKTGAAFIVGTDQDLKGVFTDGDLRRLLQDKPDVLQEPVTQFMTPNPKTLRQSQTIADGIHALREYRINSLPIIDSGQKLIGYLDIQDT